MGFKTLFREKARHAITYFYLTSVRLKPPKEQATVLSPHFVHYYFLKQTRLTSSSASLKYYRF